jgi:microcystin-dependent protein
MTDIQILAALEAHVAQQFDVANASNLITHVDESTAFRLIGQLGAALQANMIANNSVDALQNTKDAAHDNQITELVGKWLAEKEVSQALQDAFNAYKSAAIAKNTAQDATISTLVQGMNDNHVIDTAQNTKDATHDAMLAQNEVTDAGQSADIATLKVLGEIKMYVGQTAPTNWAMCHGQMMPIADNSALYAVIGNAFGGDSTTFALPDFRNRFPMGAGVSVMGVAGGSGSVTLAAAQMPTHSHTVNLEGAQANINTTVTGTIKEGATASGNFPEKTVPVTGGEVTIPVTSRNRSINESEPSKGVLSPTAENTYSSGDDGSHYNKNGTLINAVAKIPQTSLNLPVSGSVNIPIQTTASVTGTVNVESTGEGQPVSITPPYLAVNYIIRVA